MLTGLPEWTAFTPTYVGNTIMPHKNRYHGAFYPHVRGEYVSSVKMGDDLFLLPPRTWGIRTGQRRARQGPAFYPHVRGEYSSSSPRQTTWPLLPPRTWGIRGMERLSLEFEPFTPTYVGNTTAYLPHWPICTFYPHVRGEYVGWILPTNPHMLLPPRTWGIQPSRRKVRYCLPFTPTYVGNTPDMHHPGPTGPFYPHVRGEYARHAPSRPNWPLLPPRTWGIRLIHCSSPSSQTFTPTYVGNTANAIR